MDDLERKTIRNGDESVLPRLRRALGRRRASSLPTLDDPDHLLRLSDPVGLARRADIAGPSGN